MYTDITVDHCSDRLYVICFDPEKHNWVTDPARLFDLRKQCTQIEQETQWALRIDLKYLSEGLLIIIHDSQAQEAEYDLTTVLLSMVDMVDA